MPLIGSLLPLGNKLAYPAGRRPGVDPAHLASAGGINFSGVALPGVGSFVNLLNGKMGTQSGTLISDMQPIGPCLSSSVTTAVVIGDVTFSGNRAFTGGGTIAAIATSHANNLPSSYQAYFATRSSGTQPWAIGQINTTFNLCVPLFGFTTVDMTLPLNQNVPYFMAVSFYDYAAGVLSHFAGVTVNLLTGQTRSAVVSINPAPTLTNSGTYGVGVDGNNIGMAASIAAVMWSGASLQVPALLKWAADPWAFWYPRTPINWVGKVAAAAVSPFIRRNIIRASAKGFR